MLPLLFIIGLGLVSAFDRRYSDGPLRPIKESEIITVAQVNKNFAAADGSCLISGVDVIFAIDESGSIRSRNWPAVKTFIQNLVNNMVLVDKAGGPESSRVGMVLFDFYAHLQWDLADFQNDPVGLAAKISSLPYSGGGTMIATGMNMATSRFDARYGLRPDSHKVMIVMTDGQDTSDVISAREAAFAKDIKIIGIAVGPDVSYDEMKAVTGSPDLVFNVTAGYTDLSSILGKVCNATRDPCDDVDCNGRGRCVAQTDNNYHCVCFSPSQWSGIDCEIPNGHPCASSPCQNAGSCTDVDATHFSCACQLGFSGPTCSNGVCSGNGNFSCTCPFGYEGVFCERVVDFCNSTNIIHNGAQEPLTICSGHGNCSYSTTSGAHCTCDPGWTGSRCSDIIDDCKSNPCQNGGTCKNNDAAPGYYCHCPQQWTGFNCETEPDFCHVHIPYAINGSSVVFDLCGENGVCVTQPAGNAYCNCSVGFTGVHCEIRIESSCPYIDHNATAHTYPHRAVWIDDCNECRCEYGVHTCAHSLWCPHKCAVYATDRTRAAGLTVGCPLRQNCIPDDPACAANSFAAPNPGGNPSCAFPSGWCFPAGHVMVDDITLPTNPPNGFKTNQPSW